MLSARLTVVARSPLKVFKSRLLTPIKVAPLASGATLIGVNNRDLKTFKGDLATTVSLAESMRSQSGTDRFLVAESGIHQRADVARLAAAGAGAILVGESLMREKDI